MRADGVAGRRGATVGLLVAWIASVAAIRYPFGHGRSWYFFAEAVHGLLGRGGPGLGLYAADPRFQFGPLAILVAAPFTALPGSVEVAAVVAAASLLGVAVVVLLDRLVGVLHPAAGGVGRRRALLIGAVPLLVAWTDISVRTTHIDDAIALAGIVAASLALVRRRPAVATLALAVAIAAKPWAVVCAPMLATLPGARRWWRPVLAAGAAGLTWLPFVLAEPSTVSALGRFRIAHSATSALRVLGLDSASPPSWVRPAQVVVGLVVGVVLVVAGRWLAVPAAGIGLRLLLDGGTHHYYSPGLALAVLLWELGRAPTRAPWRSVVVLVVLELTAESVPLEAAAGPVRLVVLVATVAIVSLTPARPARAPVSVADAAP